jgi:hypothetical protein
MKKQFLGFRLLFVYFSIVIIVFSLVLFSCIEPSFSRNRTINQFWARDFRRNENYRVTAELLAQGIYCNVWVEQRSGINESQAQQLAAVFDNVIYERLINTFGIEINVHGVGMMNTMEYADWLGNGDGKLCILLLDIRDNFQIGVNESYIAGYFWAGDFMDVPGSNLRDMIYIDTNPGMEGTRIEEAYKTLAHEMQHLMNFVTSVEKRFQTEGEIRYIYSMDTWIDEGLSSAAEWIYANEHLQNRVDWFIQSGRGNNIRGLIDQGNNFFVWGNREDESQYAILDDYSTVYLFFQWLRLQAGDNSDIYRRIISSSYYDHRAVTTVMGEIVPGFNFSQWNVLLQTWLAANYINAESGHYGYMNDPVLKNIKVPAPSDIQLIVSLAPGEGVYSLMPAGFIMPPVSRNIRYASLSKTDQLVNFTAGEGRTLLTYNANTYFNPITFNKGEPEEGSTTGIPLPASANRIQTGLIYGRSLNESFTVPWRIDAGDFLRQRAVNRVRF